MNATARLKLKSRWQFVCRDKYGRIKWIEDRENLVVDVGLNDVLDKYFKGSTYTASWFVALKGTGTVVAGDTMGSHANWVEITDYDESARPTLTLGTVASKSVDNSASTALFTFNATATVAGAFLTTVSTKGGTTGTLYGAVDFAASRSVAASDTMNVTVTLTAASA